MFILLVYYYITWGQFSALSLSVFRLYPNRFPPQRRQFFGYSYSRFCNRSQARSTMTMKECTLTQKHAKGSQHFLRCRLPFQFAQRPLMFSVSSHFLLPYQYIPPMSGFAGAAGAGSLMVATTLSVVRKLEATLVAFSRALLVTFAGSRMPELIISTYLSFSAS